VSYCLVSFLILVLSSCGAKNSPPETPDNPHSLTMSQKCLEEKLHWIEHPPVEQDSFMDSMENDYENCASNKKQYKSYLKTVFKNHPMFLENIFNGEKK